jgi:hypothetical protein
MGVYRKKHTDFFSCRLIWKPSPPSYVSWDRPALPATQREERVREKAENCWGVDSVGTDKTTGLYNFIPLLYCLARSATSTPKSPCWLFGDLLLYQKESEEQLKNTDLYFPFGDGFSYHIYMAQRVNLFQWHAHLGL